MSQVLVAMPYWRTLETVTRAVESVLGQTHRALTLVVLNDGDDPAAAWAPLTHIDDPRLVRFDCAENRGWPSCDAIALSACDAPFFSPHDSDDWSKPDRLERLIALAEGVDVVLQNEVVVRSNGTSIVVPVREFRKGDRTFRHHSVRAGLYRADWLRKVGGAHPGFRLGYDSLLTSLAFLAGETRVVRKPLYCRVKRPGSLTQAPETGMHSPMRIAIRTELEQLWLECFRAVRGLRRSRDRSTAVGAIIRRSITPEDAAAVEREAARLRVVLAERKAA